ncbi:ER-to-golgi vesicle protein transport Sft2 [Cantharellus anzutake]|uniref:ER-to-golgi vesicle protein transport Sft2 n=1 Tax=Cantharellus anzutake TaxID=1750568 RepID=UPI0019050B40|nr:ER-to-golgi vesicle protein transport Sft2 [Cantharellus anzutake]KAF8337650.1 ER-to-golgi vesicle protein transport Sft2 [Cantharellus anzutake]
MSVEQNFRGALDQFRWPPTRVGDAQTLDTQPGPGVFSRLYNSMSSYVPLRSDERSNEEEAYFALSRWERLLGFGACLIGSAVCFAVAFFTLPLLALRPGKFALAFSLGSLLVMFGFAVLSGVHNHFKHLIAPQRLPFSASYFGSLIFTLYFSLVRKSYLGSLIFAIIQVVTLIFYVAAYFPGGIQTMRFGGQVLLRGAESVLPF